MLVIDAGEPAGPEVTRPLEGRFSTVRRTYGTFRASELSVIAGVILCAAPGLPRLHGEPRSLFWLFWLLWHLRFAGPVVLLGQTPVERLSELGPEAGWIASGHIPYLAGPFDLDRVARCLAIASRVQVPELTRRSRRPWIGMDAAALATWCWHEFANAAGEVADLGNPARTDLPAWSSELLCAWRNSVLTHWRERLELLAAIACGQDNELERELDEAVRQAGAAIDGCQRLSGMPSPAPSDFAALTGPLRAAKAALSALVKLASET